MKTYTKTLLIIALSILIGFSYSCNNDQDEVDREIIEKYISDNNLNAVELDNTGLFYVIEKEGGSKHPTVSSTVKVNYIGELVNGTRFDANDGVEFSLGGVISGWQLGIPLIGEGGAIKLLIPSALGYGSSSTGKIPEDAVLIFDVELLLIN